MSASPILCFQPEISIPVSALIIPAVFPSITAKMAEKLGHKVLPLAPYSPELNPIEKVWTNIKRYLRTVLSGYARFDDALMSYFDFN